MTGAQVAQITAALIATVTPWIVVRIAFGVAASHAQSQQQPLARPASMTWLDRMTMVALPVAIVAAVVLPAQSAWMGAIDLAIFAVVAIQGLRALGAIDDASKSAREAGAAVRVASLKARRLSDYVPVVWRGALIIGQSAALGIFVWRLLTPFGDRRLLVPVVFAGGSAVFTWLYEVWMRELVSGGDVAEAEQADTQRRRRIRQVFVMEVALAVTSLAVAHGLLNLDWERHGAWGAGIALAGACVAIVGCALAVSSDLSRRRYRTA